MVAGLGGVDPAFIQADDRFDGPLAGLPNWSSLDSMMLLLDLERELGIEFTQGDEDRIWNPPPDPFTVGGWVADVVRSFANQMTC